MLGYEADWPMHRIAVITMRFRLNWTVIQARSVPYPLIDMDSSF